MIVGESPGKSEIDKGFAFAGASGDLLDDLLKEVGISREECFVTNVCREQAPRGDIANFFAIRKADRTAEHTFYKGKWVAPEILYGISLLEAEIELVQPEMIIALGNVPMWALSGHWGIKAWRGSELQGKHKDILFQLIPTYHPAAVFREQSLRHIIKHDLRRVAAKRFNGRKVKIPDYRFQIRPTFAQAKRTLQWLVATLSSSNEPIKLGGDIETRGGHIACFGIAWSKLDAICIPLMCVERLSGYWSLEEEIELVKLICIILTHPKAYIVGQNWNYDRQYFHRWWGVTARCDSDTMAKHHAMFSTSPKGLGHLSSLYCEYHRYWKDDGRLWDPSMDEEQFWKYNCEDCVRTYEVDDGEDEAIATLTPTWPKLPQVVASQIAKHDPVFRMMVRGFRHDHRTRGEMGKELYKRTEEIQIEIDELAGGPLNVKSPKAMAEFFYEVLPITPIKARRPNGSWGVTTNDDALTTIAMREPLVKKFVARIQAMRSAGTFIGNYIMMRQDIDGRMRCSFNIPGTDTYRFSSDENAFGSGRNLQNIPTGDEREEAIIQLPNIRTLFVPDLGYHIFDVDGDSADLRFVTGDSDCKQMQAYFAAGLKPYVEIAKEYYKDPTITKQHPSYRFMKALCHGTNYGGLGAGLAGRIGLLTHEVDRMQRWYFGMCPEIKAWQEETRNQVRNRGWIENPFGYRMYYLDRVTQKTENEALAWKPQSSVALLINEAMERIDKNLPWCQLLLQVHDSLTGQYPSHLGKEAEAQIVEQATVPVETRSGTLIVPMGIKSSRISWGHC